MKFLGMDAEVNGPTYNVVNASDNASNFLVNVYPNADGVDVVDDDNNVSMNCSNPYCYSDLDYLRLIQSHIFPDSIEWVLILLYAAVFFTGLIGNSLVCFAVGMNAHMRTVTNLFIVNLATADLLVLILCLIPTMLEDVTETWYMGSVCCKIVKYCQVSGLL